MVSNTHGSFPVIFLITDGAVEDERHICDLMESHLTGKESICPRIYTFGIGNGFFRLVLQMVGLLAYGGCLLDFHMMAHRLKHISISASF